MREFLLCSVICLSANLFAARQITVTQLPELLRPLAEVETNIAFSVGSPSENKWSFTIELAPSVSNCLEDKQQPSNAIIVSLPQSSKNGNPARIVFPSVEAL